MKIKDFAKVSDVRGDDVFIHDGERGTKTIKASDLPYALFEDLPLMHKNVFRGKNLGTRMTADQIARVRDGSFKDLWIGDYWASDGMPWRIVDINYWNVHNALTIPHLVVMPDRSLYKQSMYDNDTTSSNSFWGSKVWNSIGQCGDFASKVFDLSYIRTHVDSYMSSVAGSGGAWERYYFKSKTVDAAVKFIIPNEVMVYGCRIAVSSPMGSDGLHEVSSRQLQLFRMGYNPGAQDSDFWLRDQTYLSQYGLFGDKVVNPGAPLINAPMEYAGEGLQSDQHGVRPVFAVG